MAISKEQAKRLMRRVGIPAVPLKGKNRAKLSSVKDFETFESLASPYDYFAKAFAVELEHGKVGGITTDVTHDSKIATARIVAAHLLGVESDEKPSAWRTFPAYYDWLLHMEKHGRAV